MYKAVNGEIPEYISDLMPPFVRDVTNYPLRINNNLTISPEQKRHESPVSLLQSVYGIHLMKTLVIQAAYL